MTMADHDELVNEMPILETMGTQERQKLAKKRRLQQLKRWSQREKEWIAKEKQQSKRLANIINEENNGLNLKQYTTYNSNQRTKKRLDANGNGTIDHDTSQTCYIPTQSNGVANKKEFNNNDTISGPYSTSLRRDGRVHFDVGVMLLEAAARNDFDEVKRLLSLGVSPDSVNHDGLTALHQCCIDASESIMQLLLEHGANVDARDTEQWTPLHAACTCGHLNLVRILVDHNANLLAVNGDGNMPFDICEDEATLDYIESQMVKQDITQEMIDLTRASNELNMLDSLEKLIASGGDLNQADNHGVTRLHIAAANNYLSAVKFLLNHGANVNVCDGDQWRPIHGVACWGNEQHIKIAEFLIEAGADLDARTANDETVFDLCDNIELLERLNQLKDELESKQSSGTGRLRRTQSRTNSRVHSVRRTSVRDKNQISRLEARQEAMLRVENNNDTTDGTIVSAADSQPKQSHNSKAVDCVNGLEHQPLHSKPPLKITNLDEPEPQVVNSSNKKLPQPVGEKHDEQCEDPQITTRSQHEEKISELTTLQTERELENDHKDIHLESKEPIHSEKSSAQSSQQSVIPSVQTNLSQRQPSSLVTSLNKYEHCDPLNSINCQLQQQNNLTSATSNLQVQFAPINYTLSNLKKHRSDLRMRSCSIGGVATSTSLSIENCKSGSSSLTYSANGTRLNPAVVAANEAVRLNPEPSLPATGMKMHTRSNGTNGSHLRPRSPSSSFMKFHGVPSEAFGDEAGRKTRHKCCILI